MVKNRILNDIKQVWKTDLDVLMCINSCIKNIKDKHTLQIFLELKQEYEK